MHKEGNPGGCKETIRAVHDAMYIIGGKWKISIIASLSFGTKRYSELLNEVEGISGKMLSRELKEMEINKVIKRKVISTGPVKVQYELTENARKLDPLIQDLAKWGSGHRKILFPSEK